MKPTHNSIYVGDCTKVLADFEENYFDSCVTDPPYHLTSGKKGGSGEASLNVNSPAGRSRISTGFMGTEWDGGDVAFRPETWREVLRVMKPGAHLLAFGGTRTYHKMATAIEAAGFEIRDQAQLLWVYGSGFPKSLDVSKAIDRKSGAERAVVGVKAAGKGNARGEGFNHDGGSEGLPVTEPSTADAKKWAGWGTALKPANEPIVLARKPISEKTVAANVLRWGTGALNIDACRIDFAGEADEAESKQKNAHADFDSGPRENKVFGEDKRDRGAGGNYDPVGRWPANLIVMHHPHCLDTPSGFACVAGCPMRILDTQSGASVSTIGKPRASQEAGEGWGMTATGQEHDDAGGASRFFYCAKPDGGERDRGLEDSGGNIHPTVKPVDLMAYLIKLVTPKGGCVLDHFIGSGTTAIAAASLGLDYVGVELLPAHAAIAEKRVAAETQQGKLL